MKTVLSIVAGLACVLAFAAVCLIFVFGYLACFTHGDASESYFNAAFVSVFAAVVSGAGAAGLVAMALDWEDR